MQLGAHILKGKQGPCSQSQARWWLRGNRVRSHEEEGEAWAQASLGSLPATPLSLSLTKLYALLQRQLDVNVQTLLLFLLFTSLLLKPPFMDGWLWSIISGKGNT